MSRKIAFSRPVAKGSKKQPAIRVVFRDSTQSDYFTLRKLAQDPDGFNTTQTNLTRMIISDWVKNWNALDTKKRGAVVAQLGLGLDGVNKHAK